MTSTLVAALTGLFVWSGATAGPFPQAESSRVPTYPSYTVSMTAYNAVPEQTDSSPNTTASGAFSDPDIVAARSVDLADELPFGTVIMITHAATSSPNCGIGLVDDQIGLRVIADSMHARKRQQIDILFDQADKVKVGGKMINPARVMGVCKDITITVVGHIDIKHMPKNQAALRVSVGLLQIAEVMPLAISK